MPQTHPSYPPEFRREPVRLARSNGTSVAATARQLEIAAETLRSWLRQADIDEGLRHDGLTTEETEEMRRLRREVKTLRDEREPATQRVPRVDSRPSSPRRRDSYRGKVSVHGARPRGHPGQPHDRHAQSGDTRTRVPGLQQRLLCMAQ